MCRKESWRYSEGREAWKGFKWGSNFHFRLQSGSRQTFQEAYSKEGQEDQEGLNKDRGKIGEEKRTELRNTWESWDQWILNVLVNSEVDGSVILCFQNQSLLVMAFGGAVPSVGIGIICRELERAAQASAHVVAEQQIIVRFRLGWESATVFRNGFACQSDLRVELFEGQAPVMQTCPDTNIRQHYHSGTLTRSWASAHFQLNRPNNLLQSLDLFII